MVGLRTLGGFLKKHRRVGLDSSILIYHIEGHARFGRAARKILQSIEAGRNTGICSHLSLMEVLVEPYRRNKEDKVNLFYALLTSFPNLSWEELSAEIADTGARLRAKYRLRTPDAVLIATAIHGGATGFIANDRDFKRVSELEVLLLSG